MPKNQKENQRKQDADDGLDVVIVVNNRGGGEEESSSGRPTILYLPLPWQWDDDYEVETEGCEFANKTYQAERAVPSTCNEVHSLRPVGGDGHQGWDGGYG
jgi:hypothetical protein